MTSDLKRITNISLTSFAFTFCWFFVWMVIGFYFGLGAGANAEGELARYIIWNGILIGMYGGYVVITILFILATFRRNILPKKKVLIAVLVPPLLLFVLVSVPPLIEKEIYEDRYGKYLIEKNEQLEYVSQNITFGNPIFSTRHIDNNHDLILELPVVIPIQTTGIVLEELLSFSIGDGSIDLLESIPNCRLSTITFEPNERAANYSPGNYTLHYTWDYSGTLCSNESFMEIVGKELNVEDRRAERDSEILKTLPITEIFFQE